MYANFSTKTKKLPKKGKKKSHFDLVSIWHIQNDAFYSNGSVRNIEYNLRTPPSKVRTPRGFAYP